VNDEIETAYLEAGGTLENAQAMAAHECARRSFTIAPATKSRLMKDVCLRSKATWGKDGLINNGSSKAAKGDDQGRIKSTAQPAEAVVEVCLRLHQT
jgi:hypothetical protein